MSEAELVSVNLGKHFDKQLMSELKTILKEEQD